MISNPIIREMVDADIDAVLEIEQECFLAPWSKKDLLYELHDNPVSATYVLEIGADGRKELIGFLDFMVTFTSSAISQIAIKKKYRRMDFGTMLISEMLVHLRSLGDGQVETITLEVRSHNAGALAFYVRNRFEPILIKPHYYANGDDAIYMVRRLI